jgi:hypothetical protein
MTKILAGTSHPNRCAFPSRREPRLSSRHSGRARFLLAASLAVLVAGCHRKPDLDILALNNAGISYESVQQLKALNITSAEIPQVIEIHNAGISDSACVQLLKIFHGRGQPFNAADAVANLIQARVQEATILEIARINQLGLASGELLAIHLAGLPDPVLLEVARRHAAGRPVLSGVSLASIKNTGVKNSTLLELVRRGVPDSETSAIVAMRRHRGTDADILRHFSGS